jgi:type IV pilus assembly protein PilY1
MVYFGTGKYLGNTDIGNLATQTIYGLLDDGSTIGGRSSLQAQSFIYEGPRSASDPSEVRVASKLPVNYVSQRGWYLDLLPPESSTGVGERVISVPLLRHGRLIVTSIVPSADVCKQGGYSWINEFDALSGGRLAYNVFDYTGDRLFNGDDDAIVGEDRYPVTSKKLENEGLMKSPTVISAGEIEYKVGSGTSGGIVVIEEKGMSGNPRSSWRQLFQN